MFKSPKVIIFAAIAFYAIALLVIWQQVDLRACRRRDTILESAERGYSDVIDGEIDAALRNVGGVFIQAIGGKCEPQSLERMQELGKIFNLDEVNIVNGDGIVIGSNIPSVMGFDFNSSIPTREFMALTNAHTTIVSQPFRKGMANPRWPASIMGWHSPDTGVFSSSALRWKAFAKTCTPTRPKRRIKSSRTGISAWSAGMSGRAGIRP